MKHYQPGRLASFGNQIFLVCMQFLYFSLICLHGEHYYFFFPREILSGNKSRSCLKCRLSWLFFSPLFSAREGWRLKHGAMWVHKATSSCLIFPSSPVSCGRNKSNECSCGQPSKWRGVCVCVSVCVWVCVWERDTQREREDTVSRIAQPALCRSLAQGTFPELLWPRVLG